jgi:hypothetical protein
MPAPKESMANIVRTIPSSVGCTLSVVNSKERRLAANFPKAKNCSKAKVISLVPPVGSSIMLKGGQK